MTSINAALNVRVRASGKNEIKGLTSDLTKLEQKIRKARDASSKIKGSAVQGPLLPGGSFFSGAASGGGPLAPQAQKQAKAARGGVLQFAAAADLAAGNLERVAGAGRTLLTKPIQEFFSLESAMARVASKMDVLSTQDYGRLKKAAIDTGAATGYSSKEAADGLAEMAAAGFNVEQQIAALPAVLKLAKGGE